MSRFSVALCTYNGAQYLPDQLESIAAQTRLPDELVVGDDHSTDDTVNILEDFAAGAPFPVRLHVNETNLGVVKNFEATILRCQGNLTALCDQDDVWLRNKLAKLEAVLDDKPDVGLVFGDAELIDERSKPLGRRLWEISFPARARKRFQRGEQERVLAITNVVTGATMAFRTELRRLFCPIPKLPITVHDGWIAQVIAVFAKLDFVDEPLMLYRQHAGQELGLDLTSAENRPTNIFLHKSKDFDEVARDYSLQIARLTETLAALTDVEDRLSQWREEDLHVPAVPVAPAERIKALHKLEGLLSDLRAHYISRFQLQHRRVKRVAPITRELFSRRYHRYSRGLLSALSDMTR